VRFTVRDLRPDHRPEEFETLWKLDQACFAPGIAYSRGELRAYMRRPGAFTLVAEAAEGAAPWDGERHCQNSVLGFLVAECSGRGIGHVITIDVRAEARRHRVGSALLTAAELRLRAAQCHMVRLETAVDNFSAISFYNRHGYNVMQTIPHYYSSGLDALLLEKDLLLQVEATSVSR
jgi:[ribosomal protein S18]-alanine N-acetyltransferase